MSTLRELVRQRQREISSPLDDRAGKAPGPSLRIHASNGELWGFPWAHLVYVRAAKCEGHETMNVVFVSHEVTVVGQRLTGLAEEISDQRLVELRPSKGRYATQDSEVRWIDSVEVLARDEPRDNTQGHGVDAS